ncbi:MAG: hypothetical protein IT440_02865 [Phycisphaeraceae bacterium]|nr:hypothetical protein [Phycisphaeraceae bacterium]
MSIPWVESWNDHVGLWHVPGPGHTAFTRHMRPVHPIPDAASRLLECAEAGRLGDAPVERVFRAIRAAQTTEPGPMEGALRWYLEEDRPYDANAVFFAGLGLIILWKRHGNSLDAASMGILRDICVSLRVNFMHATHSGGIYYPNAALGHLVCAWLLHELLDDPQSRLHALEDAMLRAARYWQQHHWGWAEHLSDIYSGVILDEIASLLLMSRRLPEEIRAVYTELLHDLMRIDDAFGDGPRLPALRSYDFEHSPRVIAYRHSIVPRKPGEMAMPHNMPLLRSIFHDLGWHDLVNKPARQAGGNVEIPCCDGAMARACVHEDARLGSVSRFPVMPEAEAQGWGLSWQSMPVAFWRNEGDWGYWQWATVEEGRLSAHPAISHHKAPVSRALTEKVAPPIVGRTYAMQQGGNLLFLRVMRPICWTWEQLTDRLHLLDSHAQVKACPRRDRWTQLLLSYPQRVISVHHVDLSASAESPVIHPGLDNQMDWEVTWPQAVIRTRQACVTLWGVSLDGEVCEQPMIAPDPDARMAPRAAEEAAWRVKWSWPTIEWDVRIDPLSDQPLRMA